jgi:hypothetical protein
MSKCLEDPLRAAPSSSAFGQRLGDPAPTQPVLTRLPHRDRDVVNSGLSSRAAATNVV